MTPEGSALTPDGVLMRGGLLALVGFVIAGLVIWVGMRIRRKGGMTIPLALGVAVGGFLFAPILNTVAALSRPPGSNAPAPFPSVGVEQVVELVVTVGFLLWLQSLKTGSR